MISFAWIRLGENLSEVFGGHLLGCPAFYQLVGWEEADVLSFSGVSAVSMPIRMGME